MFRLAF